MTTTGYIISFVLAAVVVVGIPGMFVYQMSKLRCPQCGNWSPSVPHSGFKRTVDIDEDGWHLLECKKCQFRKRWVHKDERDHVSGGSGGDGVF